jgi:glycosyltransferase involved in cell wall biosynthesis
VQRHGNHFQRAVELIRVAYRLRRQGCKKFFVRISASAALELGFIGRLLGLQIYYWVSGQGKDLKPPWRQGLRRRIYYELGDWLLRTNIRLVHRFVTGPESMVDYFAKEYGANPSKTIVLYNDIDLAVFKPLSTPSQKMDLRQRLGLPLERHILLSVGRVSLKKGGRLLLPLAHLLRKHLPNALLVVVGHIHMPEIVERAQQERLCNLIFVGPVPNAEIPMYYQIADVFLMPSEEEGFPRKLLEAMACGLPVVAFDVGGVRDIIHKEQLSFVLPRGDINGIVSKVVELLADASLRSQQIEFGLHKVSEYSTEAVAKMFFERIVLN